MRAAPLIVVLATASCGEHVAHLVPAHPRSEPPARADLVVGDVIDRRGVDSIGEVTQGALGVTYEIGTDRALGPWFTTHVRAALRESGLSSSAAAPVSRNHEGELSIAVVKFQLNGATWIKGEGVFDVALYSREGAAAGRERALVAAKRIVVQTTDLATEDNDVAWSQRADRLARWSAIEIARWASDRLPASPSSPAPAPEPSSTPPPAAQSPAPSPSASPSQGSP